MDMPVDGVLTGQITPGNVKETFSLKLFDFFDMQV